MDSEHISTFEASQIAKVSRPTISRALKSGDLQGFLNNSGKWMILRSDLDLWIAKRGDSKRTVIAQRAEQPPAHNDEHRDLLVKNANLEGKIEILTDQVADLKEQRDYFKKMLLESDGRPNFIRRWLGL